MREARQEKARRRAARLAGKLGDEMTPHVPTSPPLAVLDEAQALDLPADVAVAVAEQLRSIAARVRQAAAGAVLAAMPTSICQPVGS